MTDKDIIKALEWLEEIKGFCSSEEKYIYATTLVDLINSQQAEIERLKKVYQANQQLINALNKSYFLAKVEAYKECLAKVKNYIKTHCNPYGKPDFDYDTSINILNFIDKLAKEMVGENNA